MNSKAKACTTFLVAPSIAVLLASVLSLPCAVAGEPGNQSSSETVSVRDLNVDTPAGVEALYGRIRAAATRVCAESDPSLRAAMAPCIWKTEARAIEKVNLPALTAYYCKKAEGSPEALIASR